MYRQAWSSKFPWIYALAALPFVDELVDRFSSGVLVLGRAPEILLAIVIGVLAHRIRSAHLKLLQLALEDHLTSLGNRRAFAAALELECARSRRAQTALVILYIDIDRFKEINDNRGHAAGDTILKQFAYSARQVLRAKVDQAFRIGGDEFAVLIAGASSHDSQNVLCRLRKSFLQNQQDSSAEAVSFTAGLVEYCPNETSGAFLARSDKAMYAAKRQKLV